MNYQILNDQKFVIPSNIIKVLDSSLTMSEFLVLLFFLNSSDSSFDVNKVGDVIHLSNEEVLEGIDGLTKREYVTLNQVKDIDGKISDKVELKGIYDRVLKELQKDENKKKEYNIFKEIEEIFSRKLTRYESEIVNGWLDIGTPIELIQGALKEASYNGTLTFKYLDTIIYKWTSKGFKTMEDVEKYLKEKEDKKDNTELFDYDWLDDDE